MKKFLQSLAVLISAVSSLFFISCSKVGQDSVYVSTTELSFSKIGGSTRITTDADASITMYEVDGSGNIIKEAASATMSTNFLSLDWITVQNDRGEVMVTVESNTTNSSRYAALHIYDQIGMKEPADVKIHQE